MIRPATSPVPEVSIVIPVYNEEDNIPPLLEGIAAVMGKLSTPYEIILVDDGSTDGSAKVMAREAAGRPELVVVTLEENTGQTAAFHAGFQRARGDKVVTLDADLQYDPADIPVLLDHADRWDVVCGVRARRRDNAWKRFCSRFANTVRRRLTGDPIRDTGCSLKVFKREHLAALPLFDGMHRFFPTVLRMDGRTVVEVPVKHFPRRHGLSKYTARNRMFRSLYDCLAVRWMQRRRLRYRVKP